MARYAPVTEAEAAHYEMLAAKRDFTEMYEDMRAAGGHNYTKEYAVAHAAGYVDAATTAYLNALEVQFKYPEPNEFHDSYNPDWAVVAEWSYDIHGQQSLTKPPTLMNDYGVTVLKNFYEGCVEAAHRNTAHTAHVVNRARVDQHFAKDGTLHIWHYDSHGELWRRAEIRIARP